MFVLYIMHDISKHQVIQFEALWPPSQDSIYLYISCFLFLIPCSFFLLCQVRFPDSPYPSFLASGNISYVQLRVQKKLRRGGRKSESQLSRRDVIKPKREALGTVRNSSMYDKLWSDIERSDRLAVSIDVKKPGRMIAWVDRNEPKHIIDRSNTELPDLSSSGTNTGGSVCATAKGKNVKSKRHDRIDEGRPGCKRSNTGKGSPDQTRPQSSNGISRRKLSCKSGKDPEAVCSSAKGGGPAWAGLRDSMMKSDCWKSGKNKRTAKRATPKREVVGPARPLLKDKLEPMKVVSKTNREKAR